MQKTFSTGVHGQAGAFHLALQAALKLVTQLGGEEAAQIFIRDYVEKYKRLPKNGISARISLVAVEDSKKRDISTAHCDHGDAPNATYLLADCRIGAGLTLHLG